MELSYEQIRNLKVVKLIMQETGTYNQQWSRPYNSSVTGDVVNNLIAQAHDTGTVGFSPVMIASTNTFIRPQATPENQIGIVNGWDTRRIRFMLHVRYSTNIGSEHSEYLQGYTDIPGVTVNNAIAPEMNFIVNSCIHTHHATQYTPTGLVEFETISENAHILVNDQWSNMYNPVQQRTMRPEDVFSIMNTNHALPSDYSDMGVGSSFLASITLRKDAIKSRRSNGVGSVYSANILDSHAKASSSLNGFGNNSDNVMRNALGGVREGKAYKDPFLGSMGKINSANQLNRFKYSDLEALDPNVRHCTVYAVPTVVQQQSVHQTGQTANWGATDYTTQAATILSQAIPSLMMDLLINNIVFKSTNHDISGVPRTMIINGAGFSKIDMTRNFQNFVIRFETEVLRDITYNNSIPYALDMRVDLMGETWIRISIGNNEIYDFVTPSFCDALLSPIRTNNPDTVQTLASDFDTLTREIAGAIGNHGVVSSPTGQTSNYL